MQYQYLQSRSLSGTFVHGNLQDSVRTDISKPNHERQQNHEAIAVPNHEASVKLTGEVKLAPKNALDTKLTMNASKMIVITRYREVLIKLNDEATLA
jgi:hypothetical protein